VAVLEPAGENPTIAGLLGAVVLVMGVVLLFKRPVRVSAEAMAFTARDRAAGGGLGVAGVQRADPDHSVPSCAGVRLLLPQPQLSVADRRYNRAVRCHERADPRRAHLDALKPRARAATALMSGADRGV
jgi:hypothetical protein